MLPAADQGDLGTCWAFASLAAVETSMAEEDRARLSADHMIWQNGSGTGTDGGDYGMAMAYFLAWKGPVLEEQDPYGDGMSPEGLEPVCHVQEIRILPEKDYEAIKRAVYEYGGEIYVFGTPAEENLGGKVQMSEQGAFDDMDVAMMAHPAGVNLDCSNTMAINAYQISFYGKTAHAAGAPHEGINALDAMINLFNLINAMRQETTPDTRIHGIIKKGGEAPNIIPDYTESLFYVRTNRYADLLKVCDRVEACAKGAALATGCRYTMEFAEGNYKDTCSNLTLAELNAQQMEKLGVPMKRTKGKYIPGSSDLGDVSYHCPSIQSSFDITSGRKYNAHTVEFAECAGSEEGIEASFAVIEGFVMTAIELMTDPSHLEAIKDEFNKMQKN